ncbi:MAG: rhomboid family intramembrane serine protease [Flavobacteriaceae bacterium]|nr:rhomboid family intramembrane serine protease [Flavobacteriaceae bacterium]
MDNFNSILLKIKNSSIIEKLLILNSIFFLITLFTKSLFIKWFALNTDYNLLFLKPWSLFTYAFLHNNFFHLFSNLLILYYIGDLFKTFFNNKQLLYLYFYGVFSSSILFIIVGYFINSNSTLVGASGAVTALFVAVATKIPHYKIRLLLFGDVKIWVLAFIWVSLSLLQLTTNNYGGAVAHIGGALIGYFYVYFQLNTIDWRKFITFSSDKSAKKKTNLKTIYRKNTKIKISTTGTDQEKQSKIDAILDKISKSGYDSLTQEEKSFLFKQGK